jgi:hypothetical protein
MIVSNISKAHWDSDGENVRLSMPFSKVDENRRIVSGFASLDNLDKQMDIVTSEASMKAFENFRGNIREMHQPSAVGKMVSFKEDKYFDPESKKFYKGVYVSAYISKGANDAWEKVLDGTYTGFSIGGRMNKWDDAYDEKSDTQIRIIKEYDLVELSLVDSPANQFANIISVEKVDGKDVVSGSSIDTVIENVFYDKDAGLVVVSENETEVSPISGEQMENIGFVEKTDDEKKDMIKFLVDSAKGINSSKINKEVSPMTENTEVVAKAEEAEVTPEVVSEVTPKADATIEAPIAAEAEAEKADAPKKSTDEEEDAEMMPSTPAKEDDKEEKAAAKADDVVVNAITEIKDSVNNAFGDLAATLKSLSDEVANIKKSLEATTTDVDQIKGTFNEIGKRVDLVELDTAFRKSGDLGEIVQEPVMAQKSLWGGRFLKFSDLYN